MPPDNEPKTHFDDVLRYVSRLCDEEQRRFACRANAPEEFQQWQAEARPEFRRLIGLDAMESALAGHEPTVERLETEDLGDCSRRKCFIETEPDVRLTFWLVRPKGDGPFPLALTPHGHDRFGYDTSAGIARDGEHRALMMKQDRDVAVQAAREGFFAIAPATRGIAPGGVDDIFGRHDDRHCRSHFMHCVLAGRTSIGERVWDMERLIDWALTQPAVDETHILMTGNSGGGMVTLHAAACDTRITVAIPSCSYAPYVGLNGKIHHCNCNAIPGILRFGEYWDVAGLIAPRHLLIVNGRRDKLFPLEEIDRAVDRLRVIYEAAGAPDRFTHRYGEGGHRFYADLMWPFVRRALAATL